MTSTSRRLTSVFILLGTLQLASGTRPSAQNARSGVGPAVTAGQTATQLSDGRWLVVGGESSPTNAIIWSPDLRSARAIRGPGNGRAWHTATLLPDGTVVLLGGVNASQNLIGTPERFDPATNQFFPLDQTALTPRAHHTATLLTDGRLLLVGGDSLAGALAAELWNPREDVALPVAVSLPLPVRGHSARLLPDGRVLLTGADGGALFDPSSETFSPTKAFAPPAGPAAVVDSIPADGTADVAVEARMAVRLGQPLDAGSLTTASVSLVAATGAIPVNLVLAGDGVLLFATPRSPLTPGTTYTLSLRQLRTTRGEGIPATEIRFATVANPVVTRPVSADADAEVWQPGAVGQWRSGHAESPWQRLPPLKAPEGVTALAGQVLLLDGKPLANVTLEMEGISTRTDRTGRFLLLLNEVPSGWCELFIDGRSANRGRRTYGVFEYGVNIVGHRTNALPSTVWMPLIDTANAVRIDSPTSTEVVITTPRIPGLELHLPRGMVIKDEDGEVVREVSITPIPVDRPPFPLPSGVNVPLYFTIQPGGAYLSVKNYAYGPKGAWLVYPNAVHDPPGERLPFWSYEPKEKGWHVYGFGRVTADGQQVKPDSGVAIYEFSGAMLVTGGRTPPTPDPTSRATGGDPVDLATGLFIMRKTDLFLPDVLPLALTRTYRNEDSAVRPFGVGSTHPYDLWFGNQGSGFSEADLILPDGARIHFVKTSGTTLGTYVLEHFETPTVFYAARVTYNGASWELRLKNGTIFEFPLGGPLEAIRDRFGNVITVTRIGNKFGNIAKITAPHGRYIEFTYDTSDRITQAKDNLGRTVTYTYDASVDLIRFGGRFSYGV